MKATPSTTKSLGRTPAVDTLKSKKDALERGEQKKREPSGAARMLISIALKHPEVLQEAVA